MVSDVKLTLPDQGRRAAGDSHHQNKSDGIGIGRDLAPETDDAIEADRVTDTAVEAATDTAVEAATDRVIDTRLAETHATDLALETDTAGKRKLTIVNTSDYFLPDTFQILTLQNCNQQTNCHPPLHP